MKLFAWVLLWTLGVAHADPADALDPVARRFYLEARDHEASGELDEAARGYRFVWTRDATFTQVLIDLGRVLEALDDLEGAERVYQEAPFDADCVEALGRLYLATERPDEAAEQFQKLQSLLPELALPNLLEAQALAQLDPHLAAERFHDYLEGPDAEPGEAVEATALAIYDGLRAADEAEPASELLHALVERWPDAEMSDSLVAQMERDLVEEQARELARSGAQPLTPIQKEALELGRADLAAGNVQAALERLELLVKGNARSPEAWAALATARERSDDIPGAERALRMARALAPLEAQYPARLGDLLMEHYAGRYDTEAAAAYGQAVRRNPAWAEVWYRKGLAERGDPTAAYGMLSFRRYLRLAPKGPRAEEVRRFMDGMQWELQPDPQLPESEGCPRSVPSEACAAFWVAQVYADRGETESALEELSVAREAAPTYTRAINLEAHIHLRNQDTARALALYEESLGIDPAQPRVLEVLIGLEGAKDLLVTAAELGVGDAYYHLAVDAAEQWQLFEARRQLRAYFASERSGDLDASARELQARIDARFRRARMAAAGAVGSVAILVPIGVAWRRSGVSVATMLEKSPAAFRDVARICSAIRHEVLKHNTTVLAAVADALEDQDPDPAQWAADKLYGERGAVVRFWGYVRELELVGRVHGHRLNLRYRDPVFRPILAAVDQLQRLRKDVERGGSRKLAGELRRISEALNEDGYRGLSRLLRRVCLLELDEELLREVWSHVAAEAAFRNVAMPEFSVELPSESILLRIFRGELDDILVNVLRNSVAASVDAGVHRVGIRIATEEDDITGLERVALRVRDDAPKRITTALIRSRYIERGLGLTVDLISRNGGSIHVEDEAGWGKAVVVRLPRAEGEIE